MPVRNSFDIAMARAAIRTALEEDIGSGDLTATLLIPPTLQFQGKLRAREPFIVAGMPVAEEVFRAVEPAAVFRALVHDGDAVAAGDTLAEVTGSARGLLTAERTALNFLQLLSGIATATRGYVNKIGDTGCTLLDTRKTIPGLRYLSKYAVRCGGGRNHRMGLYDGVLIKDNHIAACGSVGEAVRRARSGTQASANVSIEVECDTLAQVTEAVAAGADVILLDNMQPTELRRAVALVGNAAKTEASGGVTLETIRAIAETAVTYVSVGRITHSAPAVDIGLDWAAQP